MTTIRFVDGPLAGAIRLVETVTLRMRVDLAHGQSAIYIYEAYDNHNHALYHWEGTVASPSHPRTRSYNGGSYYCGECDVRGRGTTCWNCGEAIPLPTSPPPRIH